MAFGRSTPSEKALAETVAELPDNPAEWTAEQNSEYTEKSNTVMRENATRP